MKVTRIAVAWVVAALIAPLAVESLSSYAIYRHIARNGEPFSPRGSASVALARLLSYRIFGRRVQMSADHGPLFHPDAALGYGVYPGHYEISEQLDGQNHRFSLTVDAAGRRASAYVPKHLPKHIYFTGDSAIFGWGLNDEDTVPWLLQARLPEYEIENWSQTGYGIVHALLQVQQARTQISPDDVLVLTYHPIMAELGVATPSLFRDFSFGLESRLAGKDFIAGINFPFGAIDDQGKLAVRRISMNCLTHRVVSGCSAQKSDLSTQLQVTEQAFDEIIALHLGHVLVAFIGGPDTDPVIAYLRAKRIEVVDLRPRVGDPEANDTLLIDTHGGGGVSYFWYSRLYAALETLQLVRPN